MVPHKNCHTYLCSPCFSASSELQDQFKPRPFPGPIPKTLWALPTPGRTNHFLLCDTLYAEDTSTEAFVCIIIICLYSSSPNEL